MKRLRAVLLGLVGVHKYTGWLISLVLAAFLLSALASATSWAVATPVVVAVLVVTALLVAQRRE
jgi:bacteriorhodopsin